MNLGIGEILFIIVIALIIFGPGNMVKTARDAGAFIRKVTKSPYWQEIWATKRELTELPKIIAKEAQLDQTINELDKETKEIKTGLTSTVTEFIKEVDQPIRIENPLALAAKNEAKKNEAAQNKGGEKTDVPVTEKTTAKSDEPEPATPDQNPSNQQSVESKNDNATPVAPDIKKSESGAVNPKEDKP